MRAWLRSRTTAPSLVPPSGSPQRPRPTQGAGSLRGGEVVIVVVITVLAAVLAALGLPLAGILDLLGGAAFLAGRTVQSLRATHAEGRI
ncbi:hypothetical protein F7Q99_07030 [Streptomyces kaniharaensis]|uniref:Uncharacterized protein n=1 Tax=Streptomyces kaniharaensis TaxID=212423 RepID=A0A6N7KMW6_9ACTN|nr:hypothetical protein [Streptomyces kaniharaensis]MQS12055.1 hypothetical protein [Streptomyces kaniharaensis]